ncbi:MAG TPA: bi-domain-containing oxidoreductase [Pyrinomonadaceae bacterium]|nr:bi-domain-containing oxidoreductase [Pyrinomonadaceae bacterium]
MKQVIQDLRTRQLKVADVPPPVTQRGRVMVRTAASLISAGTERMTVEMGKRSLLGKARERPDLVRQVIQKAQHEGVLSTLTAVRAKLGSVTALGYSAAGTVIGVGDDVTEFRPGDRVACAGAGYASHAEVLSVPKNLCARLPDNVAFESAAFSTLGAIALQGLRLANPTLGESFVVIGLGLIGQLTVQLLRANGCRVFGIDPDEQKTKLACDFGADEACTPNDDAQRRVLEWSRGRGADGVIITAATSSNEPVTMAGEVSRLKGRVVAVGLVGLDVPRDIYYHKELALNISMSYGPGRYDPDYEERGQDYPISYVRWTEGRNLEAFLDLVSASSVIVTPLVTHRFSVEEAERAYQLITGEVKEPYLGVVLSYEADREIETRIRLAAPETTSASERVISVGLIGAGSYAKRHLLPNFKAAGAKFQTVGTASGISAREVGEKYGFRYCVSGANEVLEDQDVNLIVVATRHDTHAELVRRALARGRHVFVEKPLALNDEQLDQVIDAAAKSEGKLMVGFNRRFSPLALAAREFFQDRQTPLSINYRVNAGRISKDHWIQDPLEGGGRIIGEVCHFIDLMQYLTGAVTTRVFAEAVASRNEDIVSEDSVFITLRFADGSNGSIAYLAEGDKTVEKERVEMFGEGKTFVLEDFRSATLHSGGKAKRLKLRTQDKGQGNEVREVCRAVLEGGAAPIELEDLAATTRATFRVMESLRTGLPIQV